MTENTRGQRPRSGSREGKLSNPQGRAARARCMNFFLENLRNPACDRRAGVMRQFPTSQVYSNIIMQYNMYTYHKRPLDAQNAHPIPMPEGARSERPEAGSRPPQGMGIAQPFWRALLSHLRGHNGSYPRCFAPAASTETVYKCVSTGQVLVQVQVILTSTVACRILTCGIFDMSKFVRQKSSTKFSTYVHEGR
jgi:hypothetical protein